MDSVPISAIAYKLELTWSSLKSLSVLMILSRKASIDSLIIVKYT